jgi:hypothetical protein
MDIVKSSPFHVSPLLLFCRSPHLSDIVNDRANSARDLLDGGSLLGGVKSGFIAYFWKPFLKQ